MSLASNVKLKIPVVAVGTVQQTLLFAGLTPICEIVTVPGKAVIALVLVVIVSPIFESENGISKHKLEPALVITVNESFLAPLVTLAIPPMLVVGAEFEAQPKLVEAT